jgi:hypothetical protein
VRDDHHRQAVGSPARHVVPEADVRAVIEALIGLIQQQHSRFAEQRQRQVELLTGAAGQPARHGPIAGREPKLAQQATALANPILAREPERWREQREMFVGGQQIK